MESISDFNCLKTLITQICGESVRENVTVTFCLSGGEELGSGEQVLGRAGDTMNDLDYSPGNFVTSGQ